jgi:hypothetical protein
MYVFWKLQMGKCKYFETVVNELLNHEEGVCNDCKRNFEKPGFSGIFISKINDEWKIDSFPFTHVGIQHLRSSF